MNTLSMVSVSSPVAALNISNQLRVAMTTVSALGESAMKEGELACV